MWFRSCIITKLKLLVNLIHDGIFPKSEKNLENNKENKPIIITISRQNGSGGREIGKILAKKLKIPFYDHAIIELATNSSSIDKSFFENSETNNVGGLLQELAKDTYHNLSLDDKVFLHQSKIIRDIAEKESCIIVGRCADFVLKDQSNLLKIFIYADIESRKDRIVNVYKEADKKTAVKKMKKVDKKRELYYNHYTKQQYGDAKNYDICLNSGMIGIEECARIIEMIYNLQKDNKS